jgi:hypothetical protein
LSPAGALEAVPSNKAAAATAIAVFFNMIQPPRFALIRRTNQLHILLLERHSVN